jgi:hypothetical protein
MKLIKRIWCIINGHNRQNVRFLRNIYGDEINFRNGYRSEWCCAGCGHYIYKDALIEKARPKAIKQEHP